MTQELIELILNNRPWIMKQTLKRVEEHGYLPYVPTEEHIWLLALDQLNQLFVAILRQFGSIPPLQMMQRRDDDPFWLFAISEARRHRARGAELPVFLGVLKYIAESYLDLVRHQTVDMEQKVAALDTVRHFFNHLVIEFSVAWVDILSEEATEELRQAALQLEEKNMQLTREQEELQQLVVKLEGFQNQLLQSEKMASIGVLAAGVAHELNNPIAYVFSNMGTMEKYLNDLFALFEMYQAAEPHISCEDDTLDKISAFKQQIDLDFLKQDIKSLLAESREGLLRVKKIVLDLKDFSHTGADEEWALTNVHAGLDSTLNIVWNELKYKCEVKKAYGELPPIACLPGQLNQVFMNLLVNAAQAIESKGTITLRTGRDDREIWVEIEDSGKGIASEHLSHIFDPFFTTKPVGQGTGLGLSVSYSIIEKHHGRFEVSSTPGLGTKFRIWLPIEQVDAESAPHA